jgi:hypothetical protein
MARRIEELEQDILQLRAELTAVTYFLRHTQPDGSPLLGLSPKDGVDRWEKFQEIIKTEKNKQNSLNLPRHDPSKP